MRQQPHSVKMIGTPRVYQKPRVLSHCLDSLLDDSPVLGGGRAPKIHHGYVRDFTVLQMHLGRKRQDKSLLQLLRERFHCGALKRSMRHIDAIIVRRSVMENGEFYVAVRNLTPLH